MATLVTGGRGFVGRHLVDQLLAAGEEVVSYNRDFAIDNRPALHTVQGELFDLPRLARAIEEHSVTRIIHTAGQSHPGVSIELPLTTWAANADGTINVFEAARLTGVKRVVNFSSECALGNIGQPIITEVVQPAPTTPYGVSKVAGELLGKVYRDLYGINVVSLRVTEVYGPGLWMPSLLCDMIKAGLAGERFELLEGGQHPFQFVYVEDVASAARLASAAERLPQHVYNVAGGMRITVTELADLLARLIPGSSYRIGDGFISDWDRQGRYDLSAAKSDLGYEPAWTLEQGLKSTIDWMQSAAQR